MQEGNTQGTQVSGQIGGYTDEMREKDRTDNMKRTALHMAQQNNPGYAAKNLVEEAQIFFDWLKQ